MRFEFDATTSWPRANDDQKPVGVLEDHSHAYL